jgi:hypothetical protein
MSWASSRLLAATCIGLLGGLGCLIVVCDQMTPARHAPLAAEFQRLVGGLGLGPAADLFSCGRSFDPRICSECSLNQGPLPGGACYCPHHASSILDFPTMAPGRAPVSPE